MTRERGTTKTPTAKLVCTVIYLQPEGYKAIKQAAAERGVATELLYDTVVYLGAAALHPTRRDHLILASSPAELQAGDLELDDLWG